MSWMDHRPALVGVALAMMGGIGHAAPFASGDVVVYRIGDGSVPLADGIGSPVFLDEYTPGGVLVQTVGLPIAPSGPNHRLVATGTAGADGQLTRSEDERYLMLTGYDADVETPGLLLSCSGAVARAVPRAPACLGVTALAAR
jgi:hypothetical protein